MANRRYLKPSGKKLFLGLCLSAIFLIFYMASGMLLVSGSIHTLDAVFTEESYYNPGYQAGQTVQMLSYDQTLEVLSLTEDQYLYDIGSMVSDSIESAGLRIKQEILDQEEAASAESSLPACEDPSSPSSNSIEAGLMHLVNDIRSSRGLQALLPNPLLSNIARVRSRDMLSRDYFSHHTPEGKNIGIILQENGIMYACCAENLGQASPPSWGSPETIINMWMGSSIHRANLLNPHFGQMGLGVVDAGGRRVVTLVLINR